MLIVTLLFIFNPFIALPFVLMEIYKRQKYAQILLAIFMGCISMFHYPAGDPFRYMEQLEMFRYQSFDDIFDFESVLIFRSFNIVFILMWIGAKIGITLELFRAILVFISFLLMFSVYNDIDKKNYFQKSLQAKFVFFIILTLSIPLYYITYGFRTGLGTCLFAYGVYHLIVNKKRIKGVIFILLSALTHFYFLLFIFILAMLGCRIKGKRIMYILIIISVSQNYIFNILYGRNDFLTTMLDLYIYGDWGDEFSWSLAILAYLLLRNGFILIAAYYIFFRIKNQHSETKPIQNFLYISFGLLVYTISFKTLLERSIVIVSLLIAIYLVLNSCYIKIQHAKVLLCLLCVGFMTPFIQNRQIYSEAKLWRITYYSLPQILLNTYNPEDVYKHVSIEDIQSVSWVL